ncbi:AbrB family transcriptional regulator [Rhodospirillum sp. A1_3_36]|uniref:AbrB family transcriptional regulator n=1 Tax=Rhodospirillum sp. A1_3_36 TaxID=3391666 RepID=UPI0039A54AC5
MRFLFGGRPLGVQWGLLLGLSLVFTLLLSATGIPAALLIGPMIAAILLALGDGTAKPPGLVIQMAQGVVGCLIAKSITGPLLHDLMGDWPVFLMGVGSVIAAGGLLGWAITRLKVLPGKTAVFGCFPGAALAMTLMAEANGADFRLVAIMQYLRVAIVVAVASWVASVWSMTEGTPPVPPSWFPPVDWLALAGTLAVIAAGIVIARKSKITAGAMLIPMVLGVLAQDVASLPLEVPRWLQALAFPVVGWSIGLRFTRPILAHAARALPLLILANIALIAICGGFAALLSWTTGVDPFTAYLAMSPGGADSMVIIAASSNVDAAFVMTMQIGRFLTILIFGSRLATWIAGAR